MIEMKIIISTLIHNVDLEILPGQDLEPISAITFGLKKELFVKVTNRQK
jgi:hypothetical protein